MRWLQRGQCNARLCAVHGLLLPAHTPLHRTRGFAHNWALAHARTHDTTRHAQAAHTPRSADGTSAHTREGRVDPHHSHPLRATPHTRRRDLDATLPSTEHAKINAQTRQHNAYRKPLQFLVLQQQGFCLRDSAVPFVRVNAVRIELASIIIFGVERGRVCCLFTCTAGS